MNDENAMWELMERWNANLTELEAVKYCYSLNHESIHSHVEISYAVIRNRQLLMSRRDLEIRTLLLLSDTTVECILKDILQTLR